MSYEKSCYGKRRMATEAKAMKYAAKREFRGIVKPYHCKYCGYWHIGGNHGMARKRIKWQ